MPEHALEVRDVVKEFRRGLPWAWPRLPRGRSRAANGNGKAGLVRAVDRVSFDVPAGEIFGILGPNGSGKSTLVRLIATLLIPDGGTVLVYGHDVVRESLAVQRMIHRVSVEASFFKKLSPMENLVYASRLYGLDAATARRRIGEILSRLGLESKVLGQPVEELSRGMQQKVSIARALLTLPPVLLLDEPTTGLDPRSKREVQAVTHELRREHGTTILLTTHDMLEAEALCDRIAILDAGRLVALDTPEALRGQAEPVDGRAPTLEDVFLQRTGKKLAEEN
ncbi:MAG: ABC transporter ATP-binding protein [Anaerolineales bacterium]